MPLPALDHLMAAERAFVNDMPTEKIMAAFRGTHPDLTVTAQTVEYMSCDKNLSLANHVLPHLTEPEICAGLAIIFGSHMAYTENMYRFIEMAFNTLKQKGWNIGNVVQHDGQSCQPLDLLINQSDVFRIGSWISVSKIIKLCLDHGADLHRARKCAKNKEGMAGFFLGQALYPEIYQNQIEQWVESGNLSADLPRLLQQHDNYLKQFHWNQIKPIIMFRKMTNPTHPIQRLPEHLFRLTCSFIMI